MTPPKRSIRSSHHSAVAGAASLIERLERREMLSTYWVDAVSGIDTAAGTAANPLKTITRGVSLARAGDTVEVRGGVYRNEKVLFTASGTSASPITLLAEPGADVKVKGSEIVQGWTPVGGTNPIYTHAGWNFSFGTWDAAFTSTPQGSTASLDARSKARNQMFVDGTYVQEVPRPTDLAPGTFYLDKTAKQLSLWLADGGDPAGHVVEAADTAGPLLNTNGQSYLVVQGLQFFHGANQAQTAAMVQVNGGSYVTVQDTRVEYAAGAGITLSNANHVTVLRSAFNHNGQLGIHSSVLTDSLVKNCENSYNDQLAGKQYDPGWEAGGDKFSRTRRVTVDGMLSHNNWGSGIWFDIDNQDATITNCVSYENRHGIHYEISYTATITNNLIYNNRLQGNATSTPNGIGIYISSSAGCLVYNNTMYGNDTYGVNVNTTIRDDGSGRQVTGVSNQFFNNIVAQNQTVASNTKSYSIGYGNDASRPPLPALTNPNPDIVEDYNHSDYNLFWLSPAGQPFFIAGGSSRPTTLVKWQQDGNQDLHSVWADPKFVNAAAGDFHLEAGSGARAVGATQALVPTDKDGRVRYAGIYDAGAFQATTKSPVPSAGGPYTVPAGGNVTLDASASVAPDPNYPLTFLWDLDGDGLFGETGAAAGRGDETGVRPTFNAAGLAAGTTFVVALKVSDRGEPAAATTAQVRVPAAVAGRFVFYGGSYWSDAANGFSGDTAIDPSKSALLPGQTATFANYVGASTGLTGVMVDVAGLPAGAALSAADFGFRIGNSSDPSTWTLAATPASIAIRRGAGVGGSDRIELQWTSGAIRNAWLQVSVLASANTGLAAPDVFYFGTAVGETGNGGTDTFVDAADFVGVRDHPADFTSRASPASPYDFNHDSFVDATDLVIARDGANDFLSALRLITAPAPAAQGAAALVVASRQAAAATATAPTVSGPEVVLLKSALSPTPPQVKTPKPVLVVTPHPAAKRPSPAKRMSAASPVSRVAWAVASLKSKAPQRQHGGLLDTRIVHTAETPQSGSSIR